MRNLIGKVEMFAGTFAPAGSMFCHGQILTINDHQGLFSIVGTIYGGDGQTTFALPDMRNRVPVGAGDAYAPGVKFGVDSVALGESEMPAHSHDVEVKVADQDGSHHAAFKGALGKKSTNIYVDENGQTQLEAIETYVLNTEAVFTENNTLGGVEEISKGNGLAHENRQPSLAINFIIWVEGCYPAQS